jgi:hypothetical protein
MKRYISSAAFFFLALLIALEPAYAADVSLPKDTPTKVYTNGTDDFPNNRIFPQLHLQFG